MKMGFKFNDFNKLKSHKLLEKISFNGEPNEVLRKIISIVLCISKVAYLEMIFGFIVT